MSINRVRISSIIDNQLPFFVRNQYPKFIDFLKQYYLSLDTKSNPSDLLQNIDQYIKIDHILSAIESTVLSNDVTIFDRNISVNSTEGFPETYGLLLIDNEIITYKSKTDTQFLNCVRGFSGVSSYNNPGEDDLLTFNETLVESHNLGSNVINLSVLFLKEFLYKIKRQIAPGFENRDLYESLNQRIFIKQLVDFYKSKGTVNSFKILFGALYGDNVDVILPRDQVIESSVAIYRIVNDLIVESVNGDPYELENLTLYQDETEFIESARGTITKIEKINRDNRLFYVVSLDYDYDKDIDVSGTVKGKFSINPKTLSVTNIEKNSTYIDVDSTIGFPKSGTLEVQLPDTSLLTINYSNKTINQFLDCSSITDSIPEKSEIRLNNYVYGYNKDGNIIKLRITGVLSDLSVPNSSLYEPGDRIKIKTLGSNLTDTRSKNWFYNISTWYSIKSIELLDLSDYTYKIKTYDDNYFIIGDSFEIRSNNGITGSGNVITIENNKVFVIRGQGQLDNNLIYTIKKKLSKIDVSNYSNLNFYNSNVYNIYSDLHGSLYVVSPSIPKYLNQQLILKTRSIKFTGSFSGEDLQFKNENGAILTHSFYTGDIVLYRPSSSNKITDYGIYYVKVINGSTIKLSKSKENIENGNFIQLSGTVENDIIEYYNFIYPNGYDSKLLEPQRLIRKISDPIYDNVNWETQSQQIGIFINGVELFNYKSSDSVYFGRIDDIDILSGGTGYDVINPPELILTDSTGSGASVNCSVSGNLKRVDILDPGVDYVDPPTIEISGGNGVGAKASVNLISYDYEIKFSPINDNTLDLTNNIITFPTYHKLGETEDVIYHNLANPNIGGLSNNSKYFVSVITENSIKLYNSKNDSISGINTVGLTDYSIGTHRFRSFNKKRKIGSIDVVDSGSNYENRKVKVTGINTAGNFIISENNGYDEGSIIVYNPTSTPISGLSSEQQYYINKIDDNNFRLCNIGVGQTYQKYYYDRNEFIKLTSFPSGEHYFNYPEITLNLLGRSGISTISGGPFNASLQPVFRGEIVDVNIDNSGLNYGSNDIINYYKSPNFTLNSGYGAQITPVVVNGRITSVVIQSSGINYTSIPDLIVVGDGKGAKLTPVISDGLIIDVVINSPGINYTSDKTTITVLNSGIDAKFKAKIKTWTINEFERALNKNLISDDDGFIISGKNADIGLQYTHIYAPRPLRQSVLSKKYINGSETQVKDLQIFNGEETYGDTHSPIIGWAYDGNPIYGPYGYSTPSGGPIKILESGYRLKTIEELQLEGRPDFITYPIGTFVEDYKFVNAGDLDEHNGRFSITPEYPNGIYSYYCTITAGETDSIGPFRKFRRPVFPYVIGNTYKSSPIHYNFDNVDSFDIDTNWVRNTDPYNLLNANSGYEYLYQPNQYKEQINKILKTKTGTISSIDIIDGGAGYKVDDKLTITDNSALVSKITGVAVSSISAPEIIMSDIEIFKRNSINYYIGLSTAPHNLSTNDIIKFSSDNTNEIISIITIPNNTLHLSNQVKPSSQTGIVTYFNITGGLSNIIEDDVYVVNDEKIKVLGVDSVNSRIRVIREYEGTIGIVTYSSGTILEEIPRQIIFDRFAIVNNSYNYERNRNIYFNPSESIGLGTQYGPGITSTLYFSNPGSGVTQYAIPTRTVYLPNHNLDTGDIVEYYNGDGSPITVSSNGISTSSLIDVGEYYVTKYNNDIIGITTNIVSIGTTNLLYFVGIGTGNYHSFKLQNSNKLIGEIYKNEITVTTAIDHNLSNLDNVDINVKSGISTTVIVRYNDYNRRLIINPLDISGYILASNILIIPNHTFNDGDKVIYTSSSVIGGLVDNEIYYIIKINNNKVKLATTKYNSDNLISIDLTSSGVGDALWVAAGTVPSLDVRFGQGSLVDVISGNSASIVRATSADYVDAAGDTQTAGPNVARFQHEGGVLLGLFVEPSIPETLILPFGFDPNLDTYSEGYDYQGGYLLTRLAQFGGTAKREADYSYTFGGTLSPVNPPLDLYRNNNIIFDLSHSSLSHTLNSQTLPAFDFKLFTDSNFKNEYLSSGLGFEVQKSGNIGIDSTSKLTLQITENTPKSLYYSLIPIKINNKPEKLGYYIDADQVNNNVLNILDSNYNGSYNIGISTDNIFKYNTLKQLEISEYSSGITYDTKSKTSSGGIKELKIVNKNKQYTQLPKILDVITENGKNALFDLNSSGIGSISKIELTDIGFNYNSDLTIRPQAKLPEIIKIDPLSSIEFIKIVSNGKNYLEAPDLLIFDGKTNELVDDIVVDYNLGDSFVNIIRNTRGITNTIPKIIPINNTNGVGINSIAYNNTTKDVTITLSGSYSDINDFPFTVGSEIFIENVSVASTEKGYNSKDYNYQFFVIDSIDPNIGGIGATFSYNISDYLGIGGIPGNYNKTINVGTVSPVSYFPSFITKLKYNDFVENETITSGDISGVVQRWDNVNSLLHVETNRDFQVNSKIYGKTSGIVGLIKNIIRYDSYYDVNSSSIIRKGWETEKGFLNNQFQRIHDSDYYQYFSYAVQSQIPLNIWDEAVDSLNHTAGFKKFSNLLIESTTSQYISTEQNYGGFESEVDYYSIVNLNCVTDFDLATENSFTLDGNTKSNEIYLNSMLIQDYFQSVGNRVLMIDDISDQFSSNPRGDKFTTISSFNRDNVKYQKHFIHIFDNQFINISQFSILSVLNDENDSYINSYGRVESRYDLGYFDSSLSNILFYPNNNLINNYNITSLTFNIDNTAIGLSTVTLGNVSKIETYNSTLNIGVSTQTNIIGINTSHRSAKLIIEYSDSVNSYCEVDELNIIHDDTNVYFVEYGQITNGQNSVSTPGIGSYIAYLSGSNINIDIVPNYTLPGQTEVNIIGFLISDSGSTGVGTTTIGNNKLDSNYVEISSNPSPVATKIAEYDTSLLGAYFITTVEDSTNNNYQTSEIMSLYNDNLNESFISEYASVYSNNQLGTFSSNVNSNIVEILFTPNPNINCKISTMGVKIGINIEDVSGIILDDLTINSSYGVYVGAIIDVKRQFELYHNNLPIFEREFDVSDNQIVDIENNTIRIPNHYFTTGEEVEYNIISPLNNPIGIATTIIPDIGSTNELPTKLYIVKKSDIDIQVSASASEALLDIPIVLNLTNVGIGTFHKITSKNQNKKCIIGIDNMIQSPIVSTSITTTLIEQLEVFDNLLTVSGITSIYSNDLIKIDDEIMRVNVVGLGSTNTIIVDRPWLGTTLGVHTSSSQVTKLNGDYNIINNNINFVTSPYGNTPLPEDDPNPDEVDFTGITTSSSFSGRVFLRNANKNTLYDPYTYNYLFDDITRYFNGTDVDFTLTENSNNITGISSSNVILLINGIFQQPQRLGDVDIIGDYLLDELSGITTLSFTGTASSTSYDINSASIPRGGIPGQIGTNEGFAYQPTVSAGGTAIISGTGSINSISIGNSGSGYRVGIQTIVNVGARTENVLNDNIEIIGYANVSSGFVTSVTVTNPGTGYTNTNPPLVVFDPPVGYTNIPLIYSSASNPGNGNGATVDIVVGQGSSIITFELSNLGYGYDVDEILTVAIGGTVGIPTYISPNYSEFQTIVNSINNDNFSGFSIGDLQVLDPIDELFDGVRKIFPILLNGNQITIRSKPGSNIDVDAILLIFVNDILQVPNISYNILGGSLIEFSEPPKGVLVGTTGTGDKTKILFYKGTGDIDVKFTEVFETIKDGDNVKLPDQNRLYNQNQRVVEDVQSSSIIRTPIYSGPGINTDSSYRRSLTWCKQTVDKVINGESVGKSRKIYSSLITPCSNIISNITVDSTDIFVDNLKTIFDSANENPSLTNEYREITIISQDDGRTATAVPVVPISSTIQSISVISGGSGYTSIPEVTLSDPTLGIYEVLWTPLDLDIVPIGWWDVTDASSVTLNSGNISQLNDLSGNGNNAVQANPTLQPLYTDAPNGQKSLGITTGSDDYLRAPISILDMSEIWSIFVVSVPIGYAMTLEIGSSSSIDDEGINIFDITTGVTWISDEYQAEVIISTPISTVYSIMGSMDSAFFDNVIGTGASFNPSSWGHIDLGASNGGFSDLSGGNMLGAIVLDYLPTNDEKNRIISWVHSKFISSSGGRAIAEATISNGSVDQINVTYGGIGYTSTNPPSILISPPTALYENIENVNYEGDFGVIVGYSTVSTGIASTGILLDFFVPLDSYLRDLDINNVGLATTGISGIQTGYHFIIENSNIGNGLTSLDASGNVIGIGSTFIDNIYRAVSVSIGKTFVSGIGITDVTKVLVSLSNYNGLIGSGYSSYYGNFSWGRLYDGIRRDPKSFNYYNNGLIGINTSPTVIRNKPLKSQSYNV